MIEYNQNVEKLETLGKKLTKKIGELVQAKEDLQEDFIKVGQSYSEAVELQQNNH